MFQQQQPLQGSPISTVGSQQYQNPMPQQQQQQQPKQRYQAQVGLEPE